MPTPDRGRTPAAFRHQLLHRLRNHALKEGVPAQLLQQRIAFERLLVRLPVNGDWILKGGFALQFRYGLLARPTKDVDLRTMLDPNQALGRLRDALGRPTIVDDFSFELGDTIHEFQGARGGSIRIQIRARVAGIEFAIFHVDLSSGDAIVGPSDLLHGSDLLQFAGIAPIEFPVYPIVQHLAEKLHAYTLPRSQENTRVKDLVDLVFLANAEKVEADHAHEALEVTFDQRKTHSVPVEFPRPPLSWTQPFAAIAATVNLSTRDLQDAHRRSSEFWNPLLSGSLSHHVWQPDQRAWHRPFKPRSEV